MVGPVPRTGGTRLSTTYPAGEGLGALVRRHRTLAGLSQTALAKASGVDSAYINRIERGVQARPSTEVLETLIRVLGLDGTLEAEGLRISAGYCPVAILALDSTQQTALLTLIMRV